MKTQKIFLLVMLLFACLMYPLSVSATDGNPSANTINITEEGDTPEESNDFTKTPYPRIATLWRPVRGEQGIESVAKHDLIMLGKGSLGLEYNGQPVGLADGFTSGSIKKAQKEVQKYKSINPDAIVTADIFFFEYLDEWLPEDHPWWLTRNGERIQFWPGTHRMDYFNPEFQDHVIKMTLSLKETGVDGVFYDNIREDPEAWVPFLSKLRDAVGDDFLIFANAGYDVGSYDFAAPFMNGMMYESGWSHGRTEWDDCIKKMQHTQSLLREPKISFIERFEETRDNAGWPGDKKRGQKPAEDPAARRWSLCYALTIGDFYYLFADNTSHRHDWYPEYDIKIGLPVEDGKRINSHVWTRKYEKALVVVNLPGAKSDHSIEFEQPRKDSLTGEKGKKFLIPPGEGRIFLEH